MRTLSAVRAGIITSCTSPMLLRLKGRNRVTTAEQPPPEGDEQPPQASEDEEDDAPSSADHTDCKGGAVNDSDGG